MALRVPHPGGVGYMLGAGCGHGHSAAHHPQAQLSGGLLQHGLNRPRARLLGVCQFVAVVHAHEAKVFGQHRQLGTGLGRLL